MGTLQYLSPEAIDGGAKGIDVDTRTDVYALGVVLFELLVGRLPFTGGDTAQLLGRVLTGEPPRPSAAFDSLSKGERARAAGLRGTDPADAPALAARGARLDRAEGGRARPGPALRVGRRARAPTSAARSTTSRSRRRRPASSTARSKFVRRHKARRGVR